MRARTRCIGMKEAESMFEETGEELLLKVKRLCEREGRMGLKLAQETILKEKTSVRYLQDAIEYMVFKYQPDYSRPALISFCCKALGGDAKPTIPVGAALTLLDYSIGIHDDIIDQSKTKNRRRTVYGKFGKDLAIILSDVLLFKGFTLLCRALHSGIPLDRVIRILETIEKTWFDQSIAETLEIKHRRAIETTPKQCLEKVRLRAAEFEACTRIGGILGGGLEKQIEDLGAYGRLVGMMGILRDELIDMLEFTVLRHRIRRESLPMPLLYALQNPRLKPKLVEIVVRSRLNTNDLQEISRLSDRSGGNESVADLIHEMSRKAIKHAKTFKSRELEIIATSLPLNLEKWKPLPQS